jgi:hypothetical protein
MDLLVVVELIFLAVLQELSCENPIAVSCEGRGVSFEIDLLLCKEEMFTLSDAFIVAN